MIAALPLVTSAVSSILGPSQAASSATSTAASSGNSFSSMLASLSSDTVDKLKTSESMSVAGLQGKATTQSVVEAVMQGQEALQTALALRDKTISAFQEISRMAI